MAQITGGFADRSSHSRRRAPPPPFILAYNASTVPILQLALSQPDAVGSARFSISPTHILRTQLATVAGSLDPLSLRRQAAPGAGGPGSSGAARQRACRAAMSSTAIGAQNLILPAGTQKIGELEYFIKVNASPHQIEELNDLPIQRQERHGDLCPGRRARARRLRHRRRTSSGWAATGPSLMTRAEDRQQLDPRHHQRIKARSCRRFTRIVPPD